MQVLPVGTITDSACRAEVAAVLQTAPAVNWDVSVHAHAAILAKHVQEGLAAIAKRKQARPHHPYISENTWALQRSVARTRRELHRLTAQLAHHTLAVGFRAWAARTSFCDARTCAQAWFDRADHVRDKLQEELKSACANLRKACRKDRDAYVSRLADDIAHAPSKEAYAALHKILMHRRKKPFSLDPLPMLRDAEGKPCADARELQALWREHFAKLEAGRATSFHALAASVAEQTRPSDAHPPCIDEVLSLPIFRRTLAATKVGRAPGIDAIPPELNHSFPAETADILYSLMLKVVWSMMRVYAQRGRTCLVLFADISAAFYRASLDRALEGLALPPEALDVIREHLGDRTALAQAGASAWLESLAAHIGHCNWFLLVNDDRPVATARGTRPGSSWADVLFAILIPRILTRRDELLAQFGARSEVPSFPWDGEMALTPVASSEPHIPLQDVVWADDIAVPKVCKSACEAPSVVRCEATALTEAFVEFGFRLSFGVHKTAALVTVSGQHSRATKRQLFGTSGFNGTIPVLLENLPAMSLPLPPCYKHLGVQQTPAGGIWEEMRYRVSQARSAFAEARRKIFGSRAIPLRRKALLLTSNVLSKLLLGAGAWPPLRAREYRLYAGAVWGFYRSVLGLKHQDDQHVTCSTCFALLQVPDPDVVLRCSRLSYLAQLLRAGPAPLWAVMRADTEYTAMLRRDLQWLYSWCHATTDWPHPEGNWPFWRNAILTMPGRYKGLCKRARCGKAYASQHRLRRHLVTSHRCLTNWGAFTPAPDVSDAPCHPLAPPAAVAGSWGPPPLLDTEPGTSRSLREALDDLEGCTEDEVFEVVAGHIEPLAVLRATVSSWASAYPHSPWHAEVSENILLLLDPAVLAESAQAARTAAPPSSDRPPVWPLPGRLTLAASGTRCSWTLPDPPTHRLPPHGPYSMPVRAADAYATWIEAATATLARCVAVASEQPVEVRCTGLEQALGPAGQWLVAAGFLLNEEGLFS
ncbi:unnamed protein product [Symbiodinium necroappetens]|uniref:C2H2-type domain-containing protein n=1 Tax=Symbiodinium necroappetens TaxID=1628268 RepID=A0A812KLK5_9DINO|nr:unnamed protein product [Symbiodinium necroappetens]